MWKGGVEACMVSTKPSRLKLLVVSKVACMMCVSFCVFYLPLKITKLIT